MNKISVSDVARNEPVDEIGGEYYFMKKWLEKNAQMLLRGKKYLNYISNSLLNFSEDVFVLNIKWWLFWGG